MVNNMQLKESEEIILLRNRFHSRKEINKLRRDLGKYLASQYGLILEKNTHDIYILNKDSKSYEHIDFDDLIMKLGEEIGPQLISETDLNEALSYITKRLSPLYNIVKFKNCVFDIKKMEIVEPKNPVFTLVETKYKYNPHAKSTYLKGFLETSLEKSNPEDTSKVIKGVKEVVGYLFTCGNNKNVLPIITGISGGGKSVFGNILIEIFGKDKIADLKIQELEKNAHASSSLVNKHLNIVNDSDTTAITNNSYIKQMTGNDPLQVNPKYKDAFVLPKEEVPKTIIICNTIPYFTKLEQALIERFIIIEFNVKFRGTEKENPHLLDDIISNPEEIEWFIYKSLKAYEEMEDNKKDFILREGDNNKSLIIKHQKPIQHILSKLISKYDVYEGENIPTNELNKAILYKSNEEGIEIATNDNNLIGSKKLINAIRSQFDLWDMGYITESSNGERNYPGLVKTEEYNKIVEELNKDKDESNI